MGSHFRLIIRMVSYIIGFLGVRQFFLFTVNVKNGSIHRNRKSKLGSRKLHIFPKVTKMGSIISQGVDYNGEGAPIGQRHIPSKN